MLYSIEDTTLTAIADAIRARCGEEPSVYAGSTEIIEYSFPSFIDEGVSFPPVAGDEYNPYEGYEIDEENAVTIPGAISLEINMYVKMRPQSSRNYVEVDGTKYTSSGTFNTNDGTEGVEDFHNFTVEGDTVIFHFWSSGFYGIGGYGYAAEIRGLDENGEYIEGGSGDSGNENGMTPLEMPDRIVNIPDYVPVIQEITITENGEYQVPEGVDGFHPIYVDVPSEEPVLQDLVVNINGVFNPPDGTDGFSMVTVNVPTGGGDLPEEAFILTGDCSGRFANGGWDWFINTYGNQITTVDITNASTMFYNTKDIVEIPFTLNFKPNYNISMSKMFGSLVNQARIQRTPAITGPCRVSDLDCVFQGAKHLKEITDDFLNGIDWSYYDNLSGNYYGKRTYTFNNCNSLRSYPVEFLRHVNKTCANSYTIYTNCFYGCYVLEEAVLPLPYTATYSSNCFNSTFNNCYRLGRAVFELQDDGTPYVMPWKNQTINLSQQVGYVNGQYASWYITDYSSGITVDKMVSDDASYQALKDDPDWFAVSLDYSRYNHDSAVETINTLPDCSATGTNTIMFKSGSGALTDGGDVANLTEEEIAIATAKGWTVTLS